MAVRSIASFSISFGLVSIPVKLYSATDSSAAIKFKLMAPGGARLRQQYVAEEPVAEAPAAEARAVLPERAAQAPLATNGRSANDRVVDFPKPRRDVPVAAEAEPVDMTPAIVERGGMVKGYEFEKGHFVLFTADELKALAEESRQTIDIVSFIPEGSIDPLYYDKPYFLAPDKRGAKPYSLLLRAMRDTGRCALARWAWRSKEYVVQIRPTEGGLVLQQLLYADEVRPIADLGFDLVEVGEGELKLARQLIEQIAVDSYDPTQFVDEEKRRILEAVERKIEGRHIVAPAHHEPASAGKVVDLMEALRASLQPAAKTTPAKKATPAPASGLGERKSARRASARSEPAKAGKPRTIARTTRK
jgi:DNA end-binding protein Ku